MSGKLCSPLGNLQFQPHKFLLFKEHLVVIPGVLGFAVGVFQIEFYLDSNHIQALLKLFEGHGLSGQLLV